MLTDENRVLVRGVQMVRRHQRQTAKVQGGIVSKESSIHISNIALADPKGGKATRVGFKLLNDGKKVRVAKRSGEQING
jgi:large subunit ribosomal protein L24